MNQDFFSKQNPFQHEPKHVHGPECDHGPAVETYVRETPKLGRNDVCSCGSGKKFKKCCGA